MTFKILSTLCEIQSYTLMKPKELENILRLNNQIFLHVCLMQQCKLSGKALNSEEEQRIRQTLKKISNNRSNPRPGHVLIDKTASQKN